jgi:hypothetical protein
MRYDEKAVRDLLDKEAIREVIGPRYARALDWDDTALLKSCFHADAFLDQGHFQGIAHEWCDSATMPKADSIVRFHYMFPGAVIVDGDRARAECAGISGRRWKTAHSEKQHFYGARYFDTLDRRGEEWKISSRVLRLDFMQTFPGGGKDEKEAPNLVFLSSPDSSNPLYNFLLRTQAPDTRKREQ